MSRQWFSAPLCALVVVIGGAGCASAPPIGSVPSAFPGAPAPRWARPADAETERIVGDLLATALALRGARYQLGGATPQTGFDCSGLVRYVLGQYEFDVPRTVSEQFRVGQAVARTHVSPGDLVFFSTTGPGATHVGIVVDADAQTFVHAPGTGSVVRLDRFDAPYWRTRFLGARRLPLAARPTS